jgi:rhodanese-related sulfurtransferase
VVSVSAKSFGATIIVTAAAFDAGCPRNSLEEFMTASVKELLATANASVPKIDRKDAAALIAGGKALVIDVRDGTEIQSSGKIKGAIHVSRGMLEFRADPESPYYDQAFDRDRTVILYCASGGRSALAGKALQELGYRDVRNLGGFKDWADGGGEIER